MTKSATADGASRLGLISRMGTRALPVADLVLDVCAPTLVYLTLGWTDLPVSVRLSIGGFLVAAKGVARLSDVATDSSQRRRLLLAVLLAIASSACTAIIYESIHSEHWSIVVGAVVLGVGLAPLLLADRRRDHLAFLVVVEIAISIVLTLISTSTFFVLVRPAIYTAVAGVYVLATVGSNEPFALGISRMVTAGGDPRRAGDFDRAWDVSSRFRRTQRWMSASLGLVLLAESVLRVVVVSTQPPDAVVHASLLSQLPGIALFALWFAGIRFVAKPIVIREVDEQRLLAESTQAG